MPTLQVHKSFGTTLSCVINIFKNLIFVFPLETSDKVLKSNSTQFNTVLILNSVKSIKHHLETPVEYLPEALAADTAGGLEI